MGWGMDEKPLRKYKVCPAPEKTEQQAGELCGARTLLLCVPRSGQEVVSGERAFLTERTACAKALRLASRPVKCLHLSKRSPTVITSAFRAPLSSIKKYL